MGSELYLMFISAAILPAHPLPINLFLLWDNGSHRPSLESDTPIPWVLYSKMEQVGLYPEIFFYAAWYAIQ